MLPVRILHPDQISLPVIDTDRMLLVIGQKEMVIIRHLQRILGGSPAGVHPLPFLGFKTEGMPGDGVQVNPAAVPHIPVNPASIGKGPAFPKSRDVVAGGAVGPLQL